MVLNRAGCVLSRVYDVYGSSALQRKKLVSPAGSARFYPGVMFVLPDKYDWCQILNGFDDESGTLVFVFTRFFDSRRAGERVRSDHNNSSDRCRCNTRADNMELFTWKLWSKMDSLQCNRWACAPFKCVNTVAVLTLNTKRRSSCSTQCAVCVEIKMARLDSSKPKLNQEGNKFWIISSTTQS